MSNKGPEIQEEFKPENDLAYCKKVRQLIEQALKNPCRAYNFEADLACFYQDGWDPLLMLHLPANLPARLANKIAPFVKEFNIYHVTFISKDGKDVGPEFSKNGIDRRNQSFYHVVMQKTVMPVTPPVSIDPVVEAVFLEAFSPQLHKDREARKALLCQFNLMKQIGNKGKTTEELAEEIDSFLLSPAGEMECLASKMESLILSGAKMDNDNIDELKNAFMYFRKIK